MHPTNSWDFLDKSLDRVEEDDRGIQAPLRHRCQHHRHIERRRHQNPQKGCACPLRTSLQECPS